MKLLKTLNDVVEHTLHTKHNEPEYEKEVIQMEEEIRAKIKQLKQARALLREMVDNINDMSMNTEFEEDYAERAEQLLNSK